MESYSVLKIESIFLLGDGRLIVIPDFIVTDDIALPSTYEGLIVKKCGATIACKVCLSLTHFNLSNSTDINRRWRITPELREVMKAEIEVGDELHVFDSILATALEIGISEQ
jgi:hypothetical protein